MIHIFYSIYYDLSSSSNTFIVSSLALLTGKMRFLRDRTSWRKSAFAITGLFLSRDRN